MSGTNKKDSVTLGDIEPKKDAKGGSVVKKPTSSAPIKPKTTSTGSVVGSIQSSLGVKKP